MSDAKRFPFVRQNIPIGPGYVGSRWWNAMMAERSAARGRRNVLIALGVTGGAVTIIGVGAAISASQSEDEVETTADALDLQRKTSWDVGGTDRTLSFAGTTTTDVDGGPAWQAPLLAGRLDEVLRPSDARLQPFYLSTLFQAPAASTGQGLKAALHPISTPATETAFLRGQALATLLKVSDSPSGVALVVDVPGPESVAVAAGLAEFAAPVFTFGNWPHPLGVVASHQTLASALYYVPLFQRMDVVRPQGAPPAFILDANRLAPYRDEANEFDNRYLANLPSVESLRSLGIQKLLYVRPDSDSIQELDDLNSDLTAYQQAGIDVRGLALTDFRPAEGVSPSPAPDGGATTASTTTMRTTHYYWGGSSGYHGYFWSSYGWNRSAPVRRNAPPPSSYTTRANAYRPTPRVTMFSTRTVGGPSGVGTASIGKQKPSGFGRVSIRTANGAVTGVRTGRSGSFGRSRFFSGSG